MKNASPTYYALPKLVQEYAVKKYEETGLPISFVHALQDLCHLGRLKTECPTLPPFISNMTPNQFDEMIQSLPFDATRIIDVDLKLAGKGTLREAGIFPDQKDVFCFKHMPFMEPRQHQHEYFEITYIYRGSCDLLFENETIRLTEGQMCIIPPLSPHNQPLEPDCLALGIVVRKSTFDSIFGGLLTHSDLLSAFFRNSLYESTNTNFLLLKTEILPRFRDIVHQLAYECHRDDPYANACSVSLLNLLLALALRQYRDTITVYRMENFTKTHHDFPLILQYIQQNFRTVTLASLSETFSYTESHLCRLIQKHLGQSFTSVVRSIKIARAQDYLENTHLKVAEISDLVGYESVDHFSRTFRKIHGMSPLRYRQDSHKRKEQPSDPPVGVSESLPVR